MVILAFNEADECVLKMLAICQKCFNKIPESLRTSSQNKMANGADVVNICRPEKRETKPLCGRFIACTKTQSSSVSVNWARSFGHVPTKRICVRPRVGRKNCLPRAFIFYTSIIYFIALAITFTTPLFKGRGRILFGFKFLTYPAKFLAALINISSVI